MPCVNKFTQFNVPLSTNNFFPFFYHIYVILYVGIKIFNKNFTKRRKICKNYVKDMVDTEIHK
ncbi:hypothetical protein NUACC26_090620 [Scytonema sp. NUACC26]